MSRSTLSQGLAVVGRLVRHPSNRKRRFRALARATAWQVWWRTVGRPVTIRAFGERKIRVRPGQHSAVSVLYTALPDYEEMTFVQRVLRPGDGFVDVGANVGVYTLLASVCVGPMGSLLAIEPDQEARDCLIENIELNSLENVDVLGVGVGDVDGWCRVSTGQGSMNRVLEVVDSTTRPGAGWVRASRLDSLIDGAMKPFLAKVDVEGFEGAVLRGASRLLAERRPAAWLLEVNQCSNSYGASRKEIWDIIESSDGFIAVYDVPSNRLRRITWGEKFPANVIAVMDVDEVERRLSSP